MNSKFGSDNWLPAPVARNRFCWLFPVDDDEYRVLAMAGSGGTVIVGENLDPVAEGTAAIVAALGVTVPILTGVLGAIVWIVTGRTLIPVERMRREVEAITATRLLLQSPSMTMYSRIVSMSIVSGHRLILICWRRFHGIWISV